MIIHSPGMILIYALIKKNLFKIFKIILLRILVILNTYQRTQKYSLYLFNIIVSDPGVL